jgi:UDP-glucose 4-epimerase
MTVLVTGGAGYVGSHALRVFESLEAIIETAWRWHKAHPA